MSSTYTWGCQTELIARFGYDAIMDKSQLPIAYT